MKRSPSNFKPTMRILSLAVLGVGLPALRANAQTANIGANFLSMNVGQVSVVGGGAFGVPPDTMGAVGPRHWVQLNNGGISMYNKDGTSAAAITTESTFWNTKAGVSATGAGAPAGDSRIIYDPLSGRWFATAFTGEATNNSILLARSDTADPTGTWKGVKITNTTGLFADYPTLGVDRNGLYIGINNFTSGGAFSRVDVYSIPKVDLLTATPSIANMTRFANSNSGTATHGVNNFNLGQTAASTGGLFSSGFVNAVVYESVSGSGAAGAIKGAQQGIVTAGFSAPPASASQPNAGNTAVSTTTLDASDERTVGSVYRVGNIVYAAHGITTGGRAGIRVTVLSISGSTATLLTEATLGGAADPSFDYIFPTIAANANGDVVVGYTRTGFISSGNANNRWPSSAASIGKLTGSTLTFGSTMELYAGERDYVSFEGTASPNRWGDYSATNLDPSDPGIFWTTQEYATTSIVGGTNWATRATEVIPNVTGEVRWKTATAGTFATGTNWFGGVAPTSTSHVIFSRDSNVNYTVTAAAGTTTTDRVSVRQGVVTLTIAGNALTATNAVADTPSLAVAEYLGTANLTVSGGGTLNTVSTTIGAGRNSDATTNGIAGSFNPSVGTLNIGNVTWNNTGNVNVGGTATTTGGTGTLNVATGGTKTVGGTLNIWNTASAVNVTSGATLTVGGLTNGAGSTPTVTLTSSTLAVNGSSNSTFTGTIAGSGQLAKSGTGTFTLGGASTYTGITTVSAGTLIFAANHLPVTPSSLTVTGTGAATVSGANTIFSSVNATTLNIIGNGKLTIATATPTPITSANTITTLTINTGGQLDLKNNAVIVKSSDTTNAARNARYAQILSGQNGFDGNGVSNWNGPGIVSSSARAANVAVVVDVQTIAVASNHDLTKLAAEGGSALPYGVSNPWLGTVSSIGADDILIRTTYSGDTNLDGTVTIDDYNNIDGTFSGLLPTNYGWVNGDFDFNGSITIDDYNAIDTGFLYQGGQLTQSMIAFRTQTFGADYVTHLEQLAAGFASVPEPASFALVAMGAIALMSRRRRA